MSGRSFPLSLLLALAAVLSAACGDLDTMISGSSSYDVGALVNGRELSTLFSVDSACVVIPTYVPDAPGDPDVVAFRIVLLDERDKRASEPFEYRARRDAAPASSDGGGALVAVDSLAAPLPSFSLPKDLPIGRYSLNLQVVGEEGVLYEERRNFFYTASAPFAVASLVAYPPGAGPSSAVPLFPAGIALLLEAHVEAGHGLDPYVVWSSGGKRLAAGRAAEGGARFLWTTPENPGFHSVEAAVYPVVPRDGETAERTGLVRSLTVATASAAAYPGLPGADAAYSYVYRLLGTLEAAGTAPAPALKPVHRSAVEWLPTGSGYGLAIGPRRSFRSAGPAAVFPDSAAASARIAVKASLRSVGTVWKAVFEDSGAEGGALVLRLESTVGGPVLHASDGGEELRIEAEPAFPFGRDARVYEIDIALSADDERRFVIALIVDGTAAGSAETKAFRAAGGRFEFGGSPDGSSDEEADRITAVIDDVAFSVVPAAEERSGREAPEP